MWVETIEEFTKRHGEHVDVNNARIFGDGAFANMDYRGSWSFYEPPKRLIDRHRKRLEFKRAKLSSLKKQYAMAKKCVSEQATFGLRQWGPPPSPEAIESLQHTASEIDGLEKEVEEMQSKLPEYKKNHFAEDREAEHKSQAMRYIEELQKLPSY